jgi:HlyD family secretion protein
MTSRLYKLAGGLAGALLVVSGGYYWRLVREIPVRTATPEQNVEVRVFGIGTIEAQIVSKIGFQIAGKVIAIEADQGQFVKAGDLLAKLDDNAQRAKLKKSEAARRQAAATLAKAQAQRERAEITYQQKKSVNARRQTLVSRGTVSQGWLRTRRRRKILRLATRRSLRRTQKSPPCSRTMRRLNSRSTRLFLLSMSYGRPSTRG